MLPASKSDLKAVGKTRTWGCTCVNTQEIRVCPYHALLDQQSAVRTRFGLEGPELAATLVFPSRDGGPCSKQNAVLTFREIAKLMGIHSDELEGIGGHLIRMAQGRQQPD